MHYLKHILCLLCCWSLFACSSTEQASNYSLLDNGYSSGYISKNYTRSQFLPVDESTIKKSLSSDHQLMMSLLYRPMTEDQRMMLTFAEQRASYHPAFRDNGVLIKGDKENDKTTTRSVNQYAHLIAQDINSVIMTAPQ